MNHQDTMMNHQDTMSTKHTKKTNCFLRALCDLRAFVFIPAALIPGVLVVGCATAPPLARHHAGRHETYGDSLYLAREGPDARRQLVTAGAPGAPAWRIAYHLGLVEEGSGRPEEARRYYAEALEGNPDWAPAASHL